jgi:hypothetical protein
MASLLPIGIFGAISGVRQNVELNCKKTPESGSGKEKAMETFAQRQSTADQGIWKNQGFVKNA